MNNSSSGKINIKYLFIIIAIIIIFICIGIVLILNNNKKENKTNEDTTTTTSSPTPYSGGIISSNDNWIAYYVDGEITECIFNNDKTGSYENNSDYKCLTGTDCCTGDMTVNFNYNGGSALGGGLSSTSID